MLYTEDQIKTVLLNVLGSYVKSITTVEEYNFAVTFDEGVTYMQISEMLGELNETDLFDIQNKGHFYLIKYIGEEEDVLEFHQHRFFYNILENISNIMEFEDTMVKRLTTLYNMQNIKYHTGFFKSIHDKLVKDKKLTKKQYDEFKFLLDHGRSKYEAGVLSTKH
jgi:hypothetical protein